MNLRNVVRGIFAESRNERILLEKMTEQQYAKTFKVLRKYVKSKAEAYGIDPADAGEVDFVVNNIVAALTAAAVGPSEMKDIDFDDPEEVRNVAMASDRGVWVFSQAQKVANAMKSRDWLQSQDTSSPQYAAQLNAALSVLESNEVLANAIASPDIRESTVVQEVIGWIVELTGEGVDVNEYKAVRDLAHTYIDALSERIPELYESGNPHDVLTDGEMEVWTLSADDIAPYLPKERYGPLFGDGMYPDLVAPRYFAVAVFNFEGCASQGEDTNWCTRFGADGEHTATYIEKAPLFVIYAEEDAEMPPGVSDGNDAPGGYRKIAQMFWSPNDAPEDGEINDVSNDRISKADMQAMQLWPFLFALYDATDAARAAHEPPDDGKPTEITEIDENGNTWTWDVEDGELISEGSEIVAQGGPYSGMSYDSEIEDLMPLVEAIGDLPDIKGIGEMSHPNDVDYTYYYLLDSTSLEDLLEGIVREACAGLSIFAPEAFEDFELTDPRVITDGAEVTNLEHVADGGLYPDNLLAVVPRMFYDWAKSNGIETEYAEYPEEWLEELKTKFPNFREDFDYDIDEDGDVFVYTVEIVAPGSRSMYASGNTGERIKEVYENLLRADSGTLSEQVINWLRDEYLPAMQAMVVQLRANPYHAKVERPFVKGGDQWNITYAMTDITVERDVEFRFPLESADVDGDRVEVPGVELRLNGRVLERSKRNDSLNPQNSKEFAEHTQSFSVANTADPRYLRDATQSLAGYVNAAMNRWNNAIYSISRDCAAILKRAVPIHGSVKYISTDEGWNRFVNALVSEDHRVPRRLRDVFNFVVNKNVVQRRGAAVFENLLSLLDDEDLKRFFSISANNESLDVYFDFDALVRAVMTEVPSPSSPHFNVTDPARDIFDLVYDAVKAAYAAGGENPTEVSMGSQ